MKGFELCEKYFWELGLPAIKKDLPECIPHLAVGLSSGSQSHGNDDELSQDHGWGPGFTVWFTQKDYDQFAEPLQEILNTLPHEYLGYQSARPRPTTSGVIEVGTYINGAIGCRTPPKTPLEWLHIPEAYLFEITPRRLFHDASGEVTQIFKSFSQYPDDAWKKRLSTCLMWMNEWGRKHFHRAERRGETMTASMYWSRFATYTMQTAFLLNHRYAPYHKWLHREFRKLPILAPEVNPLLEAGFTQLDGRIELESQIEAHYKTHLKSLGYEPVEAPPLNAPNVSYPDNELHRYARAIHRTIETPEIKKMKIFWEIALPTAKATWTYVSPPESPPKNR